ncbi:IPT/TIG domain-containing protein [Pedobacter sp. MC2016-24]|uniref:IPT/TIG domain-containing protein n=1 Tax=Pedobacter sp. MC2016-24 TaxID=2780090 RepID=UPI00187F39DA|nr:IPT/TIG domain-containing protein [Pedobacter sp. MC2016-24]MBE9601714.1 IPT/TIG domain-containing protein [Pedobacter sp. MC2016-24]
MKIEYNTRPWHIHWMLLGLIVLCFTHCKKSEVKEEDRFDPSKPVTVSDFYPKEGGAGNNLVIYGENFGSDLSKIKVMIGGKPAVVVGVKNNSLYCLIPEKAYNGDIKVFVVDDANNEIANAAAKEVFAYTRKWLASTFLGKYYEVASAFEEKEGPFNDCGAFKGIQWLSFDPKNPKQLYFTAGTNSSRLIDFEKQYVSYFRTGLDDASVMTWKLDGNRDMIVSHNHASDTKYGNYIFSRESNFVQKQAIEVYSRGVRGTLIHPQNGELYYSRFRAGDVRRYDFTTKEDKPVFTNPYSGVAIYMVMHPTGDYAYLMEYDKHYIMRTDYDRVNKTFKIPYTICGAAGTSGYADGIGTNARLNNPVQGVFVKNPDYEATGGDQYDFYFCDKSNHAIRTLTPQGRVGTFAGRGNNGTIGYANGDLRTEARFNNPTALAYDETKKCFYVGDSGNWLIRKIAREE